MGSAHHPLDVDLSYITAKLIGENLRSGASERMNFLVMTTPRDNPSELSGRQSAELIRDLLDTKHSQSYMLFALDPYTRGHTPYRKELFHNRVRFPSSHRSKRPVFVLHPISGDRSSVV